MFNIPNVEWNSLHYITRGVTQLGYLIITKTWQPRFSYIFIKCSPFSKNTNTPLSNDQFVAK